MIAETIERAGLNVLGGFQPAAGRGRG